MDSRPETDNRRKDFVKAAYPLVYSDLLVSNLGYWRSACSTLRGAPSRRLTYLLTVLTVLCLFDAARCSFEETVAGLVYTTKRKFDESPTKVARLSGARIIGTSTICHVDERVAI